MSYLTIGEQVINQQSGTLSLQIAGVDELKISTNLVEPSTTNMSNLGNASNKFNECHQNSIHLYNGVHKTSITSASTGVSTLVLPPNNGNASAPLVTDGEGALSWGIEPKIITDVDLLGSSELMNKLLALDPTINAEFGNSLAISGDYAVVGCAGKGGGGAAYIYVRTGSSWSQQAKITPDIPISAAEFGCSVAIDGDYVVVGSSFAGSGNRGAVYIFVPSGDPSIWNQQAKIVALDPSDFAYFGYSVAIDGDYIIVGANQDGISGVDKSGSVYIFLRTNDTEWIEQQKIVEPVASSSGRFGESVAISGNSIIVGTSNESVYIFLRDTDLSWAEQAKIVPPPDITADVCFGKAVAIDGDYIIVGSAEDNVAGSAYIFLRTDGVWTKQAKISASDDTSSYKFGYSVAIEGNYVIVGTNNGGFPSVYLFLRTDTSWTEILKITDPGVDSGTIFGKQVAISGSFVFIGAEHDSQTHTHNGAAYMFDTVGRIFTPTISRKYIIDTDRDFNMLLPLTSGLEYEFINTSAYTVTLSGSIFPSQPTTVLTGQWKSGYCNDTQWFIK